MVGKVSSPFDEAKYRALLEGLEVSEVKLSELADESKGIRMDSEFYQKKFLSILKNKQLQLEPLSKFVKHGYRVVYENTKILKSTTVVKSNFPIFLQATDVETPFIKTDNLFYVHESDWIRYEKGRVEKGELLIEVKGKIEKVAIVPNDFPNKVLVSGSLYKLTVNDKINKHYLLCYLISNYGQSFKDRYSSNLLIAFLSKFDLYKLPIPVFSKKFQDKIEELYFKAHETRQTSQTLYTTAETELLTALGLSDYQPSNKPSTGIVRKEGSNIKSFKDIFQHDIRLDAEFYQKKYENLINKVFSQNNTKLLKEIATAFSGYAFSSKNYIKDGVQIVRIQNISGTILNLKRNPVFWSSKKLEEYERFLVKKNDILMAMTGNTIGKCSLNTSDEKLLLNQRILSITANTKIVLPEYLHLCLSSFYFQSLIEREYVGGAQPNISQNFIENQLIPILPIDFQQKISDLIITSEKKRTQSKQLLHIAKIGVEKAIEESEAVAMAWMEKEMANLEKLTQ